VEFLGAGGGEYFFEKEVSLLEKAELRVEPSS